MGECAQAQFLFVGRCTSALFSAMYGDREKGDRAISKPMLEFLSYKKVRCLTSQWIAFGDAETRSSLKRCEGKIWRQTLGRNVGELQGGRACWELRQGPHLPRKVSEMFPAPTCCGTIENELYASLQCQYPSVPPSFKKTAHGDALWGGIQEKVLTSLSFLVQMRQSRTSERGEMQVLHLSSFLFSPISLLSSPTDLPSLSQTGLHTLHFISLCCVSAVTPSSPSHLHPSVTHSRRPALTSPFETASLLYLCS